MRMTILLLAAATVMTGCTKPNPTFCCVTAEDCAENGVTGDLRPCSEGLSCAANACVVASCSTQGCSAAAPVCNVSSDVCEACSDSSQCSRFDDESLCRIETGQCVECVASNDCSQDTPVCSESRCRECIDDDECSSGACDEGICVPDDEIVYIAPSGTVAMGSCTRTQPCTFDQHAIDQTTSSRRHIVVSRDTYVDVPEIEIPSLAGVAGLVLHGHGATAISSRETAFQARQTALIKDLRIDGGSTAIRASGARLENVTLEGGSLFVGGLVEARNIQISVAAGVPIHLGSGATLRLDGGLLRGGEKGIVALGGNPISVNISNTVVQGTTGAGMDLALASGTLEFVTIGRTGLAMEGTAGVICPSVNGRIAIKSSIIWTFASPSRPPFSGICDVSSTIAGPQQAPNAEAVDPRFVDAFGDDYHLAPDSPARDRVESGPSTDLDGRARPVNGMFDLGAYEGTTPN
jgi:hypothetical protein